MHTRGDRNPVGSGVGRSRQPEPVVVVPVVWVVPVAVRGAEVPWIVVPGTAAKDPATRGRSGSKGLGRIKPAAFEDRMAQAPSIGKRRMRDPSLDARFDVAARYAVGTPLIP